MKAEEVYRRHFKSLAEEFLDLHDREFKARFREIILNYIRAELYMGLHVMEIAKDVGLICEIAYFGAGGKWEDLV